MDRISTGDSWVLLVCSIISEMNQEKSSIKGFPKHRKAAVSFRDSQLLNIFGETSRMLISAATSGSMGPVTSLKDVLLLFQDCISYDFIGIAPDESSDDTGSNHIPNSWKSNILNTSLLAALKELLLIAPAYQPEILECITYFVCARRSLFSDDERETFCGTCLDLLMSLLHVSKRLSAEGSHRLHRLVGRFFSVYYSDILKNSTAPQFISEYAAISVETIKRWNEAEIYHLVQVWFKVVEGCGNYQSDLSKTHRLSILTVANCLIQLEIGEDKLDLSSESMESLLPMLDSCATLVRFDYMTVIDSLGLKFKTSFESYISDPTRGSHAACTWSILLIASTIGARSPYQTPDEHDPLDSRLASLVFDLASVDFMKTMNEGTLFNEDIELALIQFFLQFKKTYLSDHSSRQAAMFEIMAAQCSITTQEQATITIFEKLLINLRFGRTNDLIENTISAFVEFTSGSYTSKMLKKSHVVLFLIENHSSEHFSQITNPKWQQQMFCGITKLLVLESDDSFEKELKLFLQPLQTSIDQYSRLSDDSMQNSHYCTAISSILRKLR